MVTTQEIQEVIHGEGADYMMGIGLGISHDGQQIRLSVQSGGVNVTVDFGPQAMQQIAEAMLVLSDEVMTTPLIPTGKE